MQVYKKNNNLLIHGDNLLVMQALLNGDESTGLPSMRGMIDLIYIDPPFCCEVDKKFGMISWKKNIQQKNRVDEILPEIETLGGIDVANYLRWMYPRLYLMKELLSEKGAIYVHVDWHIGHSLKLIMDEIFGKNNYINEIIWLYNTGGIPEKCGYAKKHDTIHLYAKNRDELRWFSQKAKTYIRGDFFNPNQPRAQELGIEQDAYGLYRMTEMKDVWEIGKLFRNSPERIGYATQKPEELLKRIITSVTNENSIVADFFAGSGTTGAVAEKLGRKWIMSDNNQEAIDIMIKRLNINLNILDK